jgi:hypothetical protein
MRAVNVTRTDAHTLIMKPEGGFALAPWGSLFRSPNHPLTVGFTVHLTGLTVEVLSVTEDGHAGVVQFRFDKELEDPSLRWIAWRGKGYSPWAVPAVGASARVEAIDKDYSS